MKPSTCKITHLYHSSFYLQTAHHLFIFDYVLPSSDSDSSLDLTSKNIHQLASNRNVFVFVSHHHSDHFSPVIFEWKNEINNIHYVLSSDINQTFDDSNTHSMDPGEQLKINDVLIKTFDSTDAGVSFYIEADQLSFFHSGDLNWWHWDDFSKEKQEQEALEYKNVIEKVKKEHINIAFVPVDPRLGNAFFWAGKYFFEEVKPDLLIPMHFHDNFSITKAFSDVMGLSSKTIASIGSRGEKIFFDKDQK
ncbi:MBL fold metallo-hydrolase [Tindallia californiensis]|uniref:L-ascorbate metabolism protein UlaG, beta-lactamase superfamily n=1 Tax=Tindallia californiensis TaxID=159292 RepID=A0A1H3I969_9FIRM|nr:MBL fold metallo-hydrolase [Tindallia californiensis]SDY24181.1 L-ascorbate metabolism protein UlaG, beta-lactamase superfamily [Tindallia californiensis]